MNNNSSEHRQYKACSPVASANSANKTSELHNIYNDRSTKQMAKQSTARAIPRRKQQLPDYKVIKKDGYVMKVSKDGNNGTFEAIILDPLTCRLAVPPVVKDEKTAEDFFNKVVTNGITADKQRELFSNNNLQQPQELQSEAIDKVAELSKAVIEHGEDVATEGRATLIRYKKKFYIAIDGTVENCVATKEEDAWLALDKVVKRIKQEEADARKADQKQAAIKAALEEQAAGPSLDRILEVGREVTWSEFPNGKVSLYKYLGKLFLVEEPEDDDPILHGGWKTPAVAQDRYRDLVASYQPPEEPEDDGTSVIQWSEKYTLYAFNDDTNKLQLVDGDGEVIKEGFRQQVARAFGRLNKDTEVWCTKGEFEQWGTIYSWLSSDRIEEEETDEEEIIEEQTEQLTQEQEEKAMNRFKLTDFDQGVTLEFSTKEGDSTNIYDVVGSDASGIFLNEEVSTPSLANHAAKQRAAQLKQEEEQRTMATNKTVQISEEIKSIVAVCEANGNVIVQCSDIGKYLVASGDKLAICESDGTILKQGHPKLVQKHWDRLTAEAKTWEFNAASLVEKPEEEQEPKLEVVETIDGISLATQGVNILLLDENNEILAEGDKEVYSEWHDIKAEANPFDAFSVIAGNDKEGVKLLRSKWYPHVDRFALADDEEILEEGDESTIMAEWNELIKASAPQTIAEKINAIPDPVIRNADLQANKTKIEEEDAQASVPATEKGWVTIFEIPETEEYFPYFLQRSIDAPVKFRILTLEEDGTKVEFATGSESKIGRDFHDLSVESGIDPFSVVEQLDNLTLLKSKYANLWNVRNGEEVLEQGYEKPCRKTFEEACTTTNTVSPQAEESSAQDEDNSTDTGSDDSTDDEEESGELLLLYTEDSNDDSLFVVQTSEEIEIRNNDGEVLASVSDPEEILTLASALAAILEQSEEWSIFDSQEELLFDSDEETDDLAGELEQLILNEADEMEDDEDQDDEDSDKKEITVATPAPATPVQSKVNKANGQQEQLTFASAPKANNDAIKKANNDAKLNVSTSDASVLVEIPDYLDKELHGLYRAATPEEKAAFDRLISQASQPKDDGSATKLSAIEKIIRG